MSKKRISKNKKSTSKIQSQESFVILSNAFYEASKISFSLVFFPIVLLLAGVWLDKKLSTTPIFIILGIILGVSVGIYKSTRIRKSNYFKNG